MGKALPCTGTIFNFADSKKEGGVEYNEDGTLAVDIFRTGMWAHFWYGTIEVTEEDLDTIIKNFDDNVVSYEVSFNYHHARDKNFGIPKVLRKENRIGKFSGKPIVVLVADVALTEQGKADVESGEVLNFSSEVDSAYAHREVIPVAVLDKDGKPVKDEDGKPRQTYIQKRYGWTLMGGAVTNYPFITELNPEGLGGNKKVFDKYSLGELPFVADPIKFKGTQEAVHQMCFSLESEPILLPASRQEFDGVGMDRFVWEEIKKYVDDPVLVENCIYEQEEFKASWDAALPDAAYAIVYEVKGKFGKMLKVRKFPHHNENVKSSTEDDFLDEPRLKNAIARLDQADVSIAKLKTAEIHLNGHANRTYRKKKDKSLRLEEECTIVPDEDATTMTFTQEQFDSGIAASEAKFQTKFSEQQKALDNQKKGFDEQIKALQQDAAKAHASEWRATVSSFMNGASFSKATPAFKQVIQNAFFMQTLIRRY